MATQELIWDEIINSAKAKFDYKSFEDRFQDNEKNIPANLLFECIVGLAENKSSLILALELSFENSIFNVDVDLNETLTFIEEGIEIFQLEIELIKRVNYQLEQGYNPDYILQSIQTVLK